MNQVNEREYIDESNSQVDENGNIIKHRGDVVFETFSNKCSFRISIEDESLIKRVVSLMRYQDLFEYEFYRSNGVRLEDWIIEYFDIEKDIVDLSPVEKEEVYNEVLENFVSNWNRVMDISWKNFIYKWGSEIRNNCYKVNPRRYYQLKDDVKQNGFDLKYYVKTWKEDYNLGIGSNKSLIDSLVNFN